MATELPRIISVDDHVIEPAHLFETWLPAKYRDRGPKALTAGIGELAYVAGKYRITMDPEGQPTDWWIYEDLKFPYKRNWAPAVSTWTAPGCSTASPPSRTPSRPAPHRSSTASSPSGSSACRRDGDRALPVDGRPAGVA
ncbi:hypothetical protein SVIOM74S_03218 [Streptomyces violarus]